eukprot:188901-Alexandrium_andersonii.AAC.1
MTATHFAAEASAGTNPSVCAPGGPIDSANALVYYIGPEDEETKLAYPGTLFGRDITDGRAM